MNWTKPNFTQWVTILTVIGSFVVYVWHAENDRIDQKIHQHDLEQKVDSIGKQLNIYVTKFDELQANRIVTLKANAAKDQILDDRADKQELEHNILKTRFEDFLLYNLKK